jgi:hypothetical protein
MVAIPALHPGPFQILPGDRCLRASFGDFENDQFYNIRTSKKLQF